MLFKKPVVRLGMRLGCVIRGDDIEDAFEMMIDAEARDHPLGVAPSSRS